MKRVTPPKFRSILARSGIWTITHHDFLAKTIRIYVWASSATVLFLSIAGFISLRTALHVLLFGGLGILILLWSLIHWRKGILLDIRDEKLRQTAHAAMLALIHARQEKTSALENQEGSFLRWLKKKSQS
jgi:hypothetical protein